MSEPLLDRHLLSTEWWERQLQFRSDKGRAEFVVEQVAKLVIAVNAATEAQLATCGYSDANGGPCISPKGHPEGQHADEDFGQLHELSRLRSFAEKVAVSANDTAGTRGAARYALTGSLEGMIDEMRREG